MACPLVILVESRQRQAILTAELRPTQTTLCVRCHDPRHLRAAATRTTINDWNGIFTHAFSESSSKPHGKNGLARRDTIEFSSRDDFDLLIQLVNLVGATVVGPTKLR